MFMNEIVFNSDEVLYVENLKSLYNDEVIDNGVCGRITAESLKTALKPVISFGDVLKENIKKISPDETELTFQIKMALSGGKLAFSIVDAEAEAHLAIKFIWRNKE